MRRIVWLALLGSFCLGLSAGTISEFGGGTNVFLNEYHFGQMVMTPPGGPWNNIRFCNACGASDSVAEPGHLYLLSQSYAGLPSALPSAPGLLAVSVGVAGGAWVFSSSVVVQPETTYYFYEDGTWAGAVTMFGDPVSPFLSYMTRGFPDLNTPFESFCCMNYRLEGELVPEPATVFLLALGLLGVRILRLPGWGERE